MATSRHRKNHKEKLNNYKTKIKNMSEQAQTSTGPIDPRLPEIQNTPYWDPNDIIKVKGWEWEVIYNSLVAFQTLSQAINTITSRSIVEGVIKMDFKKLNPQTLQYEEMTPEEKAPYDADFAAMVETFRKANLEMEKKEQEILNQETVEDQPSPIIQQPTIIIPSVN